VWRMWLLRLVMGRVRVAIQWRLRPPAAGRWWRWWLGVIALLLLCELLVLVWEVLRVSVYELWVGDVVRQWYESISSLVLSVLITTRRPSATVVSVASITSVRLVRGIRRLVVVVVVVLRRGERWREVRRCWMPARHVGLV